ncbi:hypothetical protein MPTK1_1g07680 [Marchantia polymorpha subsp. ruderalis]|uniref:Uncharacterized protein n=2 Tax=Marchantia polymorpha TaxID=3197 RepID=A0AAF6AMN1_MARPO|nr:hypothetical protein MARPO_0036s0014 [Marchantia polymorpha]BBM97701.1 hypothetical protein Mp_1g07680 [Marchantia polymorpha subsp. ruderalis]|eukprot:PTQ41005.1 hypothetical protein MARPO_0036s0014 [Marchantia polymorpha]
MTCTSSMFDRSAPGRIVWCVSHGNHTLYRVEIASFGISDRIPLINSTLSSPRDVFPGGAQSGLESRGERASAAPLSSLLHPAHEQIPEYNAFPRPRPSDPLTHLTRTLSDLFRTTSRYVVLFFTPAVSIFAFG